MRSVKIQEGKLYDAEFGDHILCWRHTPAIPCHTQCAAFAQVMMQTPGRQELAAVCTAVPQAIPVGSLGEPSNIVVAPPGAVTPIRR